jgi:hypothetical protein
MTNDDIRTYEQDQEYDPERYERLYGVDLSLLEEQTVDTPPLPLETFGMWSNWIGDAARDAGCPPDYVAASLLAGASAAVGNAYRVCAAANGWFEQPAILWMALVGEPSTGKSPGMRPALDTLKRVENDEITEFEPQRRKFNEDLEIAKAKETAWQASVTLAVKLGEPPPPCPPDASAPAPVVAPQIVVGDTTPEALTGILAGNPRGVIQHRDELAGLLGGFDRYRGGGSERAMYLEAYDAGAFRVSRKAGGTISIPRLAVAICGGLQPDRFATLIANSEDDGLQARFLYVYPERQPFEGRPACRIDRERLFEAFSRLRKLDMSHGGSGPEPKVLPLSEFGTGCFEQWMRDHDNTKRGGGSRYRSWAGKSPGRILRLALLIEMLEWAYAGVGHAPTKVSDVALMRATCLHEDYFSAMARKTFADAGVPESEKHAREIAYWIAQQLHDERPHSVTVREVYKNIRVAGIRSPKEAQAALDVLVDAGWLIHNPRRSDGRPGKPSNIYEIRQDVWLILEEIGYADGGQKCA